MKKEETILSNAILHVPYKSGDIHLYDMNNEFIQTISTLDIDKVKIELYDKPVVVSWYPENTIKNGRTQIANIRFLTIALKKN